jgi:hypothetical protein
MNVLFALLLVTTLVLSSGCSFFRKDKKPKPSQAIATEVAQEFRARWIAQRAAELVRTGAAETQDQATAKAEADYAERFPTLATQGR